MIADDCTGCTLCAKGCSFGAIRMHALADLNVSKYFPDRSPDAKGLNIAQKCDNCTGYADKACITACPTGAMFRWTGWISSGTGSSSPSTSAPASTASPSPENRPSLMARWFWGLFALVNTLIVAWECIGRLYWPGWTFGQAFYTWGLTETGLDPSIPSARGSVRPLPGLDRRRLPSRRSSTGWARSGRPGSGASRRGWSSTSGSASWRGSTGSSTPPSRCRSPWPSRPSRR
ncbi:MAG: 4Fe-4S dicluster domain-containing protein [bacterium]